MPAGDLMPRVVQEEGDVAGGRKSEEMGLISLWKDKHVVVRLRSGRVLEGLLKANGRNELLLQVGSASVIVFKGAVDTMSAQNAGQGQKSAGKNLIGPIP